MAATALFEVLFRLLGRVHECMCIPAGGRGTSTVLRIGQTWRATSHDDCGTLSTHPL